MSGAFELDAVDVRGRAQEGVDMLLLDPAGNDTGVVLVVRGFDSRAYKDVVERQLRHRTEIHPRKLSEAESKAEFYEENAALLAGWKGKPFTRGGKAFEYSPANAALLLQEYDWILEQVRAFARNRRNFLPGSATS